VLTYVTYRACLASIMRLYYSILLVTSNDITWRLAYATYWGFSEIAIGLICCCLPTIPKFVQFVGPKLSQVSLGRYTTSKTSTSAEVYVSNPKTSRVNSSNDGVSVWTSLPKMGNSDYQELPDWPGKMRTVDITGNGSEGSQIHPESGQIVRTVSVAVVKGNMEV
jgi:hypothetical protein